MSKFEYSIRETIPYGRETLVEVYPSEKILEEYKKYKKRELDDVFKIFTVKYKIKEVGITRITIDYRYRPIYLPIPIMHVEIMRREELKELGEIIMRYPKERVLVFSDDVITDPERYVVLKRKYGEELDRSAYFYYLTKPLYLLSEKYRILEYVLYELGRSMPRNLDVFILDESIHSDIVNNLREAYGIRDLPALIVSVDPIQLRGVIKKTEKSYVLPRDFFIDEICENRELLRTILDHLYELCRSGDIGKSEIVKLKLKRILGKLYEKISLSLP